ncbi:hypothetical protein ACOMHN_010897 [Nucella lapillus]
MFSVAPPVRCVQVRGAGVPGAKGRDLSPRTRERLGVKGLDLRRPVRPVDREKMRPWLHNLLDSGSVFGLKWLHKDQGTFHVSWRHASRLGWKLETDGDVFEKWARHTGEAKAIATHTGEAKAIATHTGEAKAIATHTGEAKAIATHTQVRLKPLLHTGEAKAIATLR